MERMPSPSSPMACARVLAAEYLADDQWTLRHWRGSWLEWADSRWIEMEAAAIRAQLYKRLEGVFYSNKDGDLVPWLPNKPKIAHLLEAMAAVLYLPDHVNPPTWMAYTEGDPTGPAVACANGILDVNSRYLRAPTPRYFNTVAVPFAYEPDPPTPVRWLTFLHDLWPDDEEAIACLQEWFGYVLSGRTDLHKMLLVVGPTRSGKGTIARVLTRLVGAVAAPTLLSLASDFGMAALIGKALCVIPDARIDKRHGQAVVERLLSISGEDTVEINRKYRDVWTGKLGARVMILSNELPELVDESGAIGNRFILLPMMNSFLGRENTLLLDQLEAELPAILNWALDGLTRLLRNGRLTTPSSAAEAVRTMADLVSPISAFLYDQCETGPGQESTVDSVWEAWKRWCDDNGVNKGTRQSFGKKLGAARPSVKVLRQRDGDARTRTYKGLSVRAIPGPWSAGWAAHSADRAAEGSAEGPRSENTSSQVRPTIEEKVRAESFQTSNTGNPPSPHVEQQIEDFTFSADLRAPLLSPDSDQEPPDCPDCGWPVDSSQHTAHEEQP